MRKSVHLIATFTLIAAAAFPATIGAENCKTDACGNGSIANTKPDAAGFVKVMKAFGHTLKFWWSDGSFYTPDQVDASVTGGLDTVIGDAANITFYSTHGGSNVQRYWLTTGRTMPIDGVLTCESYTSHPQTGKQWWKLGDGQNRILNLSTCHGLQLTDLGHWNAVAKGLHLICGYDGEMSDSPSVGSSYAFLGNLGFSAKQAWFAARPSGDRAVVMAYGTSPSNAINRRDKERFSSSMAAATPHSWRAWAWIQ